MQNLHQKIKDATIFLQQLGIGKPVAGVLLGTGLGALIERIRVSVSIPYSEIPHFPVSTVEFHKGNLLYGHIEGTPVVVMQGRFHYYEGYSMQQITFPIRVMKELDLEYLLLSNAAGGINPHYKKGDLVIIKDHINHIPDNPLLGVRDIGIGKGLTDMNCLYDKKLRQLFKGCFVKKGIPINEGIYVAVPGPNLETRAEYRWLRTLGADMVGMSTVPEVIVAAQMRLPCAALSVITNECDPYYLQPLNIAEIIEVVGKADKMLTEIFVLAISQLR
jgi:purine-nucleoside phosphorylase